MIDVPRLLRARHVPHLNGSGDKHARSGWVQLHCVRCDGSDGGWHLGYSPVSGAWSCYRCGTFRFWEVIPKLLRLSETEARRLIAREFTDGKPAPIRPARVPVTRQRAITPPGGAQVPVSAHLAYLTGRGYDAARLVREWGLLGTGHLGGDWAWRIVAPVRNSKSRVVAYQGRIIGDADPKYKFTEDALCLEPPDSLLYGIDRVEGDTVLIVEGVTGVWRLGAGTVATFGIDWKRPQANQLRRFGRRFVLFDPEPSAQRRARELAAFLSLYPGETEILSGFETDPGEFGESLAQEIRREIGLR